MIQWLNRLFENIYNFLLLSLSIYTYLGIVILIIDIPINYGETCLLKNV